MNSWFFKYFSKKHCNNLQQNMLHFLNIKLINFEVILKTDGYMLTFTFMIKFLEKRFEFSYFS